MKYIGILKSFDEILDIMLKNDDTYPIIFIDFLYKNQGVRLEIEKSDIGTLWDCDVWNIREEYFEKIEQNKIKGVIYNDNGTNAD